MPDRDDNQRHWQQLAEQLGLPPDPAEQSPSPPSAPIKHEAKSIPKREEVRLPEPEPASAPASVELREGAEEPRIETTVAGNEQPAPPVEEKRRMPRGRRRGRRGGRHAEEKAADATTAEAGGEEAPEGQGPAAVETGEEDEAPARDRSRRRGRGRSRRKKETADVEESTAAPDAGAKSSEEPTETADEGEDAAGDDVSGVTIPSWQELIESLYRPDR
jgi:hypothetical protein